MNAFGPLLQLLSGKFGWMPTLLGWLGAVKLAAAFIEQLLLGRLTRMMVDAAAGTDSAAASDWEAALRTRRYRIAAFAIYLVAGVRLPSLPDFLRAKAQGKQQPTGALATSQAPQPSEGSK